MREGGVRERIEDGEPEEVGRREETLMVLYRK